MTDDIVARLRKERDALHAGLSAIIHCQSALRRSEMREAAAGLLDKVGLKPMWFDGDQSPFVRRALAAEARVRELEAENKRLAERLDLLAVGFGVPDGGRYIADWQTKIEKLKAAERALAGAYERAAKVAELSMASKNLADRSPAHIATAIRELAQEVKHEAE